MKLWTLSESGELLDERDARVVPGREEMAEDDPARYLVPACSTAVPPPELVEGHARVFLDGSWSQVEDHRGKKAYRTIDQRDDDGNLIGLAGDAVVIGQLGPVPDFLTDNPRPSEFHVWENGEWVEDVAAKRAALPAITRRQLLIGLKNAGFITGEEAVAAAQSGAVPAAIQAIFDQLPTQGERDDATITWASMSVAERSHPLVAALAAANQMTDEQVDQFFASCAAL